CSYHTPMLREGGRLALSDFAKVAAHSSLLKARAESKWHRVAGLRHQTIPCVRERGSLFTGRTVRWTCGRKVDGVSGTRTGESGALTFRESNNFCFALLLGFALRHEFLRQVVHDVGDGPVGLISQFSELHQRGLIERVQWTAVQRERRDVTRRCF